MTAVRNNEIYKIFSARSLLSLAHTHSLRRADETDPSYKGKVAASLFALVSIAVLKTQLTAYLFSSGPYPTAYSLWSCVMTCVLLLPFLVGPCIMPKGLTIGERNIPFPQTWGYPRLDNKPMSALLLNLTSPHLAALAASPPLLSHTLHLSPLSLAVRNLALIVSFTALDLGFTNIALSQISTSIQQCIAATNVSAAQCSQRTQRTQRGTLATYLPPPRTLPTFRAAVLDDPLRVLPLQALPAHGHLPRRPHHGHRRRDWRRQQLRQQAKPLGAVHGDRRRDLLCIKGQLKPNGHSTPSLPSPRVPSRLSLSLSPDPSPPRQYVFTRKAFREFKDQMGALALLFWVDVLMVRANNYRVK